MKYSIVTVIVRDFNLFSVAGHITEVPADPGPSIAKMMPPFLYMEWPPQDSKFMSISAICCQHFLVIVEEER